MVKQADDGSDLQLAQTVQTGVRPRPLKLPGRDFRPLPQDGIAQSLDAELGEAVQIFDTIMMSGKARLISPVIAHPIHGALVPSPKGKATSRPARSAGRRRQPRIDHRWFLLTTKCRREAKGSTRH